MNLALPLSINTRALAASLFVLQWHSLKTWDIRTGHSAGSVLHRVEKERGRVEEWASLV